MIQHLTAIWKFRHFLISLIKLDLRLRYRRSIFGLGWSLLNPIAMTIVFCLVFSSLLGNGDWRFYAPYLLSGMAVWGFLRDSVLQGCRALLNNEAYIRQSPLPYGLYSLRTVGGQSIHFLIAMLVVVVMCMVLLPGSQARPGLASPPGPLDVLAMVPVVVPGLVLAFLFAWSAATIMSFANVYFQDTQHLLEVGAQIMFFLTPIMYGPEVLIHRGLKWMIDLNPVNLYLDMVRIPLLTGQIPGLQLYVLATLVTVAFVGLAWGTVAWLQKRVIFHM